MHVGWPPRRPIDTTTRPSGMNDVTSDTATTTTATSTTATDIDDDDTDTGTYLQQLLGYIYTADSVRFSVMYNVCPNFTFEFFKIFSPTVEDF